LKRKTSSVVDPDRLLKKYSRKTGRNLKHHPFIHRLRESIDGADGSPRVCVTIQFTTSSVLRDGNRDGDVAHGEARVIAGECGGTAEDLLRQSHERVQSVQAIAVRSHQLIQTASVSLTRRVSRAAAR
jgi:hypothetical protein